jgi:hypothetical protein
MTGGRAGSQSVRLLLAFGLLACGVLASGRALAEEIGADDKAAQAMKAAVYGRKEIADSFSELYLQQNRTEQAISRAAAAAAEAKMRTAELSSKSMANDLQVRADLFAAQARYNVCIFLMVVAVVCAGLWFSYLQFTVDRRAGTELHKLAEKLARLASDDPARTALLARLDGTAANRASQSFEAGPLKVSSNVIGLVVLAMSLAFFYLYVDRVYTIQINRGGTTVEASQTLGDSLRKAVDAAAPKAPAPVPAVTK